jgi:hypothetical protein
MLIVAHPLPPPLWQATICTKYTVYRGIGLSPIADHVSWIRTRGICLHNFTLSVKVVGKASGWLLLTLIQTSIDRRAYDAL